MGSWIQLRTAAGNTYRDGPISSRWQLAEKIGEGSFAVVRRAQSVQDPNQAAAVKVIRKSDDAKAKRMILRELVTYRTVAACDAPNVVSLFEISEDHEHVYLVMELVNGQDLASENKPVDEATAARYAVAMLSALRLCHQVGVTHRDITPMNFMKTEDGSLKLMDFGVSFYDDQGTGESAIMSTQCGTPQYMSPEVVRGQPYDSKCDVWSVGAVLYELLTGRAPFHNPDQRRMLRDIRFGQVLYLQNEWAGYSKSCCSFISQLLTKDASNRLTAQQALRHQWIANESCNPIPERKTKVFVKARSEQTLPDTPQSEEKYRRLLQPEASTYGVATPPPRGQPDFGRAKSLSRPRETDQYGPAPHGTKPPPTLPAAQESPASTIQHRHQSDIMESLIAAPLVSGQATNLEPAALTEADFGEHSKSIRSLVGATSPSATNDKVYLSQDQTASKVFKSKASTEVSAKTISSLLLSATQKTDEPADSSSLSEEGRYADTEMSFDLASQSLQEPSPRAEKGPNLNLLGDSQADSLDAITLPSFEAPPNLPSPKDFVSQRAKGWDTSLALSGEDPERKATKQGENSSILAKPRSTPAQGWGSPISESRGVPWERACPIPPYAGSSSPDDIVSRSPEYIHANDTQIPMMAKRSIADRLRGRAEDLAAAVQRSDRGESRSMGRKESDGQVHLLQKLSLADRKSSVFSAEGSERDLARIAASESTQSTPRRQQFRTKAQSASDPSMLDTSNRSLKSDRGYQSRIQISSSGKTSLDVLARFGEGVGSDSSQGMRGSGRVGPRNVPSKGGKWKVKSRDVDTSQGKKGVSGTAGVSLGRGASNGERSFRKVKEKLKQLTAPNKRSPFEEW